MNLTERIAYIRGLADGLKLDGEKDEVKVIFLDGSVHVGEDEVLSWNSAPVADDFLFDVSRGQWAFKEWVVEQIKLGSREVVGRAPESI